MQKFGKMIESRKFYPVIGVWRGLMYIFRKDKSNKNIPKPYSTSYLQILHISSQIFIATTREINDDGFVGGCFEIR